MDARQTDHRETWLTLESEGAREDADQAFRTLASAWARVEAPTRLVARVAAAGYATVASRAAWPWTARAAVAAALLLTGLAAALTPADAFRVVLVAAVRESATALAMAVDGATAAWQLAAAALGPVVSTARALALALTQPLPLVVLSLNIVMASLGLAALRRLLAAHEV